MEVNIYAVGPWLVSEIAHAAAPKQWLLCFVIHVPVATHRSPARDCFILVAAFTYYYYMDTWIELQHAIVQPCILQLKYNHKYTTIQHDIDERLEGYVLRFLGGFVTNEE